MFGVEHLFVALRYGSAVAQKHIPSFVEAEYGGAYAAFTSAEHYKAFAP
jgi:hypothetical protein